MFGANETFDRASPERYGVLKYSVLAAGGWVSPFPPLPACAGGAGERGAWVIRVKGTGKTLKKGERKKGKDRHKSLGICDGPKDACPFPFSFFLFLSLIEGTKGRGWR